jgi:hypothetical protein
MAMKKTGQAPWKHPVSPGLVGKTWDFLEILWYALRSICLRHIQVAGLARQDVKRLH